MNELMSQMEEQLPALAREVIVEYLDYDAGRQQFLADPDGLTQHKPRWHQFGIVTHSMHAVEAYNNEVPPFLSAWSLGEEIDQHLSQQIDNVSRRELLGVGLLFHDISKFAARTVVCQEGQPTFTFRDHERYSGRIIRSSLFDVISREFDISPSQREYIARCGERHFDLGLIRKRAKASPEGYTIAFTQSEVFHRAAADIASAQPGFAPEIGMLFLADNLGKTSIRLQDMGPGNDTSARLPEAQSLLNEQGLDPNLIDVVVQLPVDVEVARRYLESLCIYLSSHPNRFAL